MWSLVSFSDVGLFLSSEGCVGGSAGSGSGSEVAPLFTPCVPQPQSACAHTANVSIHSCDFTNGYFPGQEIDRILPYRIPAEGIPEEGIAGGEMLASRVPVYGAQDTGRGLWLRLTNTCKQFKFFTESNTVNSVHAS